MKKIFFFDIDGTLAMRGQVPEGNREALRALKEKGYLTFICSGRPGFYALRLFGDLVSGCVACNGRYIIYQNKKLMGKAFTREEMAALKERFRRLDCGYLLTSDEKYYFANLEERHKERLIRDYGPERLAADDEGLPVYTFDLFYQDLEHRDRIVEDMKDIMVFNDHRGTGSGDCSTLDFDKGNAIAYLLEYFQIPRADAYAFGDGYNDQAMFREVDHRIAMGNGVDALKAMATYVTDDIHHDGIRKALQAEGIL